jgi:hypothetical protein
MADPDLGFRDLAIHMPRGDLRFRASQVIEWIERHGKARSHRRPGRT